ncbi:MAG: TonB-dependent receptor [Prevotellaceae bacterium]|nr:TonB-dependent receptor [Prevotellaceae bacterium]
MDKRLLGIIVCMSSCFVAYAQTQDKGKLKPDSVYKIDEVVVTAQQSKRLVTSQTLEGKDLQSLSSSSIADALKYFAGVQIKDYGGLGGLKTINVRSLGSQHVGIYLDGVRITNAQNGTVDLGKYSLSTMESISLYNANKLDRCQTASEYASGATVYMKTRRPVKDSLTVQGRVASFHTYGGKVNGQMCRNDWSAFVDTEYMNSKGDYPFRYKSQYEDTVGTRANSDITYLRIEGGAFHKGFASHIYYYASERGCPGGVVRRLSDKYDNVGREWDRDFFAQATYDYEFTKAHRIKATAKYAYEYLRYCTDYPENQNTARGDNHYWQNDLYAALSYNYNPASWLGITAGYDFRYSKLDADLKKFEGVERIDQKAVVSIMTSWRGLSFAASGLYQHYKDYTWTNTGAADPLEKVTPTFSLSYTWKGLTGRLWYKQIFRAPTLNDLYYTQAGNRNLRPEYTKQWNVGIEYHLTPKYWNLAAQVDLYENRVTDRIVCLPMKGTYTWSMLNYGYTFCQGMNANLSARWSRKDLRASLITSFTLQDDRNRTDPDNEDTYDQPICYSPKFSCGVTAIAGWKWLSLTVSDLHVSKRMWSYADTEDMLKPYDNVDVKLSANYKAFGISLEVMDLFDVQYEMIQRYPMPGRNYKLTLTYSL